MKKKVLNKVIAYYRGGRDKIERKSALVVNEIGNREDIKKIGEGRTMSIITN